jgi:hypothetical protein
MARRWIVFARAVTLSPNVGLIITGTVGVVVDIKDAAALAETKLAEALPRRRRHVRSVARRARRVATTLSLADDLAAAAWLHDIGYSPELAELAAEFSPADPLLADAMLYCDMTTGPDGDYVRPADRLAEIRRRYGPGHEVTRSVEVAASEILATAGRIEVMLAAQPK